MRTTPDTADLIATARAALKAEVLPHLPPDRRYVGLMVLNALGIAERQLEQGVERRAAARRALAAFAEGDTLDALTDALARDLRARAAEAEGLQDALLEVARAATRESNPRARILGAAAQPPANGSAG